MLGMSHLLRMRQVLSPDQRVRLNKLYEQYQKNKKPDNKLAAVSSIAQRWALRDAPGAAAWVADFASGAVRDGATGGFRVF